MDILIASGNTHKVEEIRAILKDCPVNFKALSDFPPMPEPVEDGSTYIENAFKKALNYHRAVEIPVIADDSGLEIDAFNGEPGIYSARYVDPKMSFSDRNQIILKRMKNIPAKERTARFVCGCVLICSIDDIRTEYGILEGEIGSKTKGKYGFGYDPIFYLPDRNKYLAELPPEEKNLISHRAAAFNKMKYHLMNNASCKEQSFKVF